MRLLTRPQTSALGNLRRASGCGQPGGGPAEAGFVSIELFVTFERSSIIAGGPAADRSIRTPASCRGAMLQVEQRRARGRRSSATGSTRGVAA